MKTLLMLTRSFPPMFSIGGKRPYRFAKHLPEHGWRPVIVTSPIPESREVDPTAGGELDPSAHVERTFSPTWWPGNKGGAGSDGTVSTPTRKPVFRRSTPLERLKAQFRIPIGRELALLPYWFKLARDLVERHQPDAIFATSGPYTALLFGALARAVAGRDIPLILDLRDPWTLNFGQQSKPGWVRALESRVEEQLLLHADKVTFTCDTVVEAYRQHFTRVPPERLTAIYNSFDPEQRPAARDEGPPTTGPARLVHFGNCYWGRSLETIIRAVARLQQSQGLSAEDLLVENLGRMAQEDLDLMDELGVSSMFVHRTFVPYAEGLDILARADALLIVGWSDKATLFVAGKMYDYFLAGRPILCLSPPCDQTRLVLETHSGVVVDPRDVDGTVHALERIIAAHNGGPPIAEPDPEAVDAYSSPRTTAQLAAILDELVV